MDGQIGLFVRNYGNGNEISCVQHTDLFAANAAHAANTLLLVFSGRAVDAAGAVGGGAAPDALVGAGAVAVLARGRVDTARSVT